MTHSLPQRLFAVQGPTAGGRSYGLVVHFMVPCTRTIARIYHAARAPARGAVGRCAAARMARLDSAQRGFGDEGACHV